MGHSCDNTSQHNKWKQIHGLPHKWHHEKDMTGVENLLQTQGCNICPEPMTGLLCDSTGLHNKWTEFHCLHDKCHHEGGSWIERELKEEGVEEDGTAVVAAAVEEIVAEVPVAEEGKQFLLKQGLDP